MDFNIKVDELTNEDLKSEQPPNALITLKSHQLTLLQRCKDFENRTIKFSEFENLAAFPQDEFKTRMGIIADRVGSGKSYIVLALIASNDIMEKDNTIIKSCGMNNIVYFLKDNKPVVKTNMLVIPHNLCSQWENYITSFSKTIKYKIVNKQKIIDKIVEDNVDVTDYDLIVVTATFFNKICKMVNDKNIKLQRIIFDEVDNINIPGCYHVYANFYWFISASYGNLLYPKGHSKYDSNICRHVWSATGIRNSGLIKNIFLDLYNNIPRDFMKVMVLKNSESYIESSITLPPVITNIIKSKTPHSINILNGIVDKNVIDCLNAGDIERAIGYISTSNKGTEDNIVAMLIEKYNKQLKNLNLTLMTTNDYFYDTEDERVLDIASITKKIADVQNKITLIKNRIQDNDICSICYDDIDNKTVTRCCQNPFCFKCINIWLSKKAVCPLCKTKTTSSDIFVISNAECSSSATEEELLDETEYNEKFDKWKNFEILLKKKKGNSKMLIFSNYDSTFANITQLLKQNGIRYDYVKGNSNQINCIVDRYKGTQLDALLINTRHYATGMNLENTTDVVMFHKFDVQMTQQVVGRAHRYGRVNSLNVHYLLYENEMNS